VNAIETHTKAKNILAKAIKIFIIFILIPCKNTPFPRGI
jgi:hypothetical protein